MKYLVFVILFFSISFSGCSKEHTSSSNTKIPEVTKPEEIDNSVKEKHQTEVEFKLIGAIPDERFKTRYSSNFNESLLLLAFVGRIYKPWEKHPTGGTVSFFVDSFDSLNEANFEKCKAIPFFGLTRNICAIKNCTRIPLVVEGISSASCHFNNLDSGIQYSIFAYYSGDDEHSDSRSQDVHLQVNPISFGELTLVSSTSHSHFREEVTFEVTLNYFEKKPIGEIKFYIEPFIDFFDLPLCSQKIEEKITLCTTSKLHIGENKIRAVFLNDDRNYLKLESNTITINVQYP